MPKNILIFLFSVISVVALAQPGSINVGAIRSRVTDSTTVVKPAGTGTIFFSTEQNKWRICIGTTCYDLPGNGSGGGAGTDIWGNFTGDIEDQTDLMSWLKNRLRRIDWTTKTTNYTPIVSDTLTTRGFVMRSGSDLTFTIPNYSTQPFRKGTSFIIVADSAMVELAGAAGVRIEKSSTTLKTFKKKQHIVISKKNDFNTWYAFIADTTSSSGIDGRISFDYVTKTGNYSPVVADTATAKGFLMRAVTPLTFTIPNNSAQPFNRGTTFIVIPDSLGMVTIEGGSNVEIETSSTTLTTTKKDQVVVVSKKNRYDSWLVWIADTVSVSGGSGDGTVTSVGLEIGTSGTDVNVSNSPITSSGDIVLNIPSASATARGPVNTVSQQFAGQKTFLTAPVFSTMSSGSVLFAGASGLLSQDNTNFNWDNTNKKLSLTSSVATLTNPILSLRSDQGSLAHGLVFRNTSTNAFAQMSLVLWGTLGSFFITQTGDEYGTTPAEGFVDAGGVGRRQSQIRSNNASGNGMLIWDSSSDTNTGIRFRVGFANSPIMKVNTVGLAVGGDFNATARLHLAAGTATASTAPLKFTSGTPLTTPENGAMEYHSSHLYFTIGSTRYQLDQQGGGGVTLTGSTNELFKYSGGNGVATGLASPSAGNLDMGLSGTSGSSRLIQTVGLASDIGLGFLTKGTGDFDISTGGDFTFTGAGVFSATSTGNMNLASQSDINISAQTVGTSDINISASGDLTLQTNSGDDVIVTASDAIRFTSGGTGDVEVIVSSGSGRYLIITGLPTTCSGAPSGAIWNDSGTLKICP